MKFRSPSRRLLRAGGWKFWKRPPSLNLLKNVKRYRPVIVCREIVTAIIAAIITWWGTTAVTVLGIAITWGNIVTAILIVGCVWYSHSQSQKAKKTGQARDFRASGHLINTTSQSEPIPIHYGTCRVGGNVVYKHCTGTDNKYYHRIITFGYGPVQGPKQDGQGDKIWLDDKRIQDFGSLAYWEFFTGTPTQTVCATLQAAHPEFDDAMRDIAYLYLRLEYNSDKFASEPQVTIEGEWRKLYDPRNGQTVFSANNALVAYDFLRSDLYSIGLPTEVFDVNLSKDAANWCDANGYQFNGPIMERQSLLDNLEVILQNFRAGLVWSEGFYKLLVYEYDTPVMHLTEDDIEADSFKIIAPGIPETPNRVLITYIDAANNYVSKTKPIEDPQAVLIYDGEERDFEIDLKGTTNALQAEKLGSYYVDRNRLNLQFPLVAHPRALALDPMDMIQITHSMPGWTEKIVRVLDVDLRQDGKVNLLVLAELSSLYDDDVDISTHNVYQTNLPNPFAPPPNVVNVEINEELYGTKNNILTRLIISFSTLENYPFFDHAEIWISDDGGINYICLRANTGDYSQIDSVDEGLALWVKIVPVNNMGVKRPIDLCTPYYHFVFGKTAKPSDVTELWADASIGGIRFNWTPVDDIDLNYYEIRWAPASDATWDEAIEIAKSYATSKSFPAAKNGKYFIKAIDTTGNESINAISVITEIPTILDWNVQEQLVEDPLFEGIKTDMFVDGGILCLGSAGSFDSDDMFDGDLDFDWGEYGVIGVGYYETDAVDLGTIQSSRCGLSFEFEGINWSERWDSDEIVDSDEMVDGEGNMVGIIPQIALSQDGVAWGDWVNFFVGDYIAQALKFRIKAFSDHPNQYIAIAALGFDVDMPDRIESGQDAVIPAGGVTIDFLKPYMVKPKIGLTLQSANAGDYYYLSAVDENGFTIQIKNSGGVGIEKTIDWESRGY